MRLVVRNQLAFDQMLCCLMFCSMNSMLKGHLCLLLILVPSAGQLTINIARQASIHQGPCVSDAA